MYVVFKQVNAKTVEPDARVHRCRIWSTCSKAAIRPGLRRRAWFARFDAKHADDYAVVIDKGHCGPPNALRKSEESGIFWAGMGESLNRLILGYGTGLPQVLQQNLGVPVNQIPAAVEVIKQAFGAPLAIPAMPLKDAIDLAEFLADVAIKFSKFSPGANVVGGPIEIAVISKHEGFRWVRRKFYFDRNLTPDEK